jgi:hypothetical protein
MTFSAAPILTSPLMLEEYEVRLPDYSQYTGRFKKSGQ